MLGLVKGNQNQVSQNTRVEGKEPNYPAAKWSPKAWDAFEYRTRVPALAQHDRDKSTRKAGEWQPSQYTGLISVGPKRIRSGPSEREQRVHGEFNLRRQNPSREKTQRRTRSQGGDRSDDSSSEPEKVNQLKPPKTKLKAVGEKTKDYKWLNKVKKNFVKKFYAPSTLASKNAKRKRVTEILENVKTEPFPLTVELVTTLAAVLDSTGMKAGDQYLAEARAMHVEAGFDWDQTLDKHMASCKRAMQRDKGPEVRAKEVKIDSLSEKVWAATSKDENVPRRVAWSYAWACIWMLRAIEAANLKAKDVLVDTEQKTVKLTIRKSKMDQRGFGAKRTLKCCGQSECSRDCPFKLAVETLDDLKKPTAETSLFPDAEGAHVSKFHMVPAWAKALDSEMSGHSARRSGAMRYARQGMSIQTIQFLGRWRSSAVFRYIEEAMTEIPMNTLPHEPQGESTTKNPEESQNRRALRPKASAKAKAQLPEEEPQVNQAKQLISDGQEGPIYAISRSRGGWTKHIVGKAAWGIPLDSWSTICGWNFARRNVKVELTQNPSKNATECKKCSKFFIERDGVKGAREWAQHMKGLAIQNP
jgi:hypothetical protein